MRSCYSCRQQQRLRPEHDDLLLLQVNRLLGPDGSYLKHIEKESGATLALAGEGAPEQPAAPPQEKPAGGSSEAGDSAPAAAPEGAAAGGDGEKGDGAQPPPQAQPQPQAAAPPEALHIAITAPDAKSLIEAQRLSARAVDKAAPGCPRLTSPDTLAAAFLPRPFVIASSPCCQVLR